MCVTIPFFDQFILKGLQLANFYGYIYGLKCQRSNHVQDWNELNKAHMHVVPYTCFFAIMNWAVLCHEKWEWHTLKLSMNSLLFHVQYYLNHSGEVNMLLCTLICDKAHYSMSQPSRTALGRMVIGHCQVTKG